MLDQMVYRLSVRHAKVKVLTLRTGLKSVLYVRVRRQLKFVLPVEKSYHASVLVDKSCTEISFRFCKSYSFYAQGLYNRNNGLIGCPPSRMGLRSRKLPLQGTGTRPPISFRAGCRACLPQCTLGSSPILGRTEPLSGSGLSPDP